MVDGEVTHFFCDHGFCLLVARFLNNFLRSDYLISFEIDISVVDDE